MNRRSIFASMGVPEVWRNDVSRVVIYVLDENGKYRRASTSRQFPVVSSDDLLLFQRIAAAEGDETIAIRQFRQWVCGW